jgi:hypothetical protein
VQFSLNLNEGCLSLPAEPVTVPADASFFWPFNLDLYGAQLIYATAQPICTLEQDDTYYIVFAQTAGMDAEFVFDTAGITIESTTGQKTTSEQRCVISNLKHGTDAAICLQNQKGQKLNIILLDEATSLACWKGRWGGRERVILSQANLMFDGDDLRLRSMNPEDFSAMILPSPEKITVNGTTFRPEPDGLFGRFTVDVTKPEVVEVKVEKIKNAGPAREVQKGTGKVAEAPSETDWQEAAVWRITFSDDINIDDDYLLHIAYAGDIARLYCGENLLTDNFYNGDVFEVGLKRYAPDVYQKGLTLKILPLSKDVPVYLPEEVLAEFGTAESLLKLTTVELFRQTEFRMTAR